MIRIKCKVIGDILVEITTLDNGLGVWADLHLVRSGSGPNVEEALYHLKAQLMDMDGVILEEVSEIP